jgi:hypothetical protein
MGIYEVKSNTCNCKGSWSTLDGKDFRVYMDKPCPNHQLKEGNIIYYKLIHLLDHIIKIKKNIKLREVYPLKILQVCELGRDKKILKVEVNHNGDLNTDNFDTFKQMYFSQMNDEPMWKKIDDNRFEFIFVYMSKHHTIEDEWERFDY